MDGISLREKKYMIIDMDGTFYLDGQLISGAKSFLKAVLRSGKDFYFFTNNSSNDEPFCRARLREMGYPVEEGKVMVSSQVALDYIQARHADAAVYLLGNERFLGMAKAAGVTLTENNPDIVLLGFDTTLTYEKIHKAANFIAGGALYYATHPDKNCPAAEGFLPDTGSMIELFAASTGRYPEIFGKPTTHTVDYITKRLGCKREELAFIGDRLETDIAIGARHGITSALVMTGVTTPELYEHSEIRADIVANSLADLVDYL